MITLIITAKKSIRVDLGLFDRVIPLNKNLTGVTKAFDYRKGRALIFSTTPARRGLR